MSVSGVSGTSTSSLDTSRASIADNFDTFLSLLTTQLKHQNPLDPLDTNQFTQQLVQFTSVEQQLKTNDFLEAMMMSTQNAAAADSVGYIGKEVTASGVTSELVDGQALWMFNLASDAEEVTVTIKDEGGNTVYTHTGALSAGEGIFSWDGLNSNGGQSPDGSYSISIDARDSNGGYIATTTEIAGTVTGVDLSGSEPVLLLGAARINLSTVTSVRTVTTSETTGTTDETDGT